MKKILSITAVLICLSGINVTAQVSRFTTTAFSRTSLDMNENWKPWSDWLPVTDGHFLIDKDNMKASLDIDSWGTHIEMRIDSTAEGLAGQDIPLYTFYCNSMNANNNQKQYIIEILAYRKPGVGEIQYQYTIYLTELYSSTKFLARYNEAAE
ncbi:MAG: hypothetical protein AB9888_15645 [Bacteroidales bacterium]|jgi:hypothetical protein